MILDFIPQVWINLFAKFLILGITVFLCTFVDIIFNEYESSESNAKKYKHLNDIANILYDNSKNNIQEEVVINLDELNFLSEKEKELNVVKRIILANGHTYCEISKIDDDKTSNLLESITNEIDSDAQDFDKAIDILMTK